MPDRILQLINNRPNIPIIGSAGVSVTSATVSWFEQSLPMVQWVAAVLAIISGGIAILIGARQLWKMAKADWFAPKS